MKPTLLVIEDDSVYSELLEQLLTHNGFQVQLANNAATGLKLAYSIKPDAVILDIMLPGVDGWQICARLREVSDVPIIMLTAFGSKDNVVKGLNLGADDFIIKPVTMNELVARIRAVLRRVPNTKNGEDTPRQPIVIFDDLTIDFTRHQVTVDGKRISLSPIEFRLLSALVQHRGRMLSHEFLLREVWGSEYMGEVEYLRQYISYLRYKIEKDPAKPNLIHNEWGYGYRFG
ncbi:MAG: response regulator transcription factor [Anaerolineales bacterium]|nr:response regulator transcription factor [Anaerolineales bacterium]